MLETLDHRRRELHKRADYIFVESLEFCQLLVGRKKLRRSDEKAAAMRGLIDPATGVKFLIEEEKLFLPSSSVP